MDGETNEIDHNVRRAPGAGDVNLSAASVPWTGPDEALDAPLGSDGRSLSAVAGSTPVLTADEDVFTLTLNYRCEYSAGQLAGDESAVVRITTASVGRPR